jgi:hypothetical protein
VLGRLEKVEKQNCRLKRVAALVLTAVGTLVLMGQAGPTHRIEASWLGFATASTGSGSRVSVAAGNAKSLPLPPGQARSAAGARIFRLLWPSSSPNGDGRPLFAPTS